MKSEKDKASLNQKVFVPLENVMKLQAEYLHAVKGYNETKGSHVEITNRHLTRVRTFETIIRTLALPINIVGI